MTLNAEHDESVALCVDTQPLIAIVAAQSSIHFVIAQLSHLISNLEGDLCSLGRPQEFALNFYPLPFRNEAAFLHVGQDLPRYLQK